MISIIIPTYNEEKILAETLKNLRQIKKFPIEIVVSDGKSEDQTVEIAKQHADKVVEYAGTGKPTISHNRNAGARVAQGEYLAFMDASVTIPDADDFFARVLAEFAKDNGLSAASVSVRVSKELETRRDRFFWGMINLNYRINNNLLKMGTAIGKFQMMRQECFEKVGGYDETLVTYEDNDMYERIAKIGKTRMLHQLTVFQPGRREHRLGWARFLSIWMINVIWVKLGKKAFSTEWRPVR